MKVCVILNRFNNGNPFTYNVDDKETNYNYMMPIGLSYISSALKNNGDDVTFLNLNHRGGLIKDILNLEFKVNKYDFVFMGSLSFYYPNIRDYIKYIREASPSTIIVVGGGLVSSQPVIMLKLLKPDIAVIGEGEITVVEIVNCLKNMGGDLSKIDGIGYIAPNGEIIINKPRLPIENLDSVAFPDHDGNELSVFLDHMDPSTFMIHDRFDVPRTYPLLMSRSCPFKCTFCYHQLGPKYRQRSIDNIMEEIKAVTEKYKINTFLAYDELFAQNKERIVEFCTKFKEFQKTIPWEIKWNCSLRVDNVNDDLIKMMKDAGCCMVGLGLESYSNTVLKSMNKHITSDQIKRAMEIITNNGLAIQGTFIFGDSAETLDTAKETLDFYKNNQNIIRGGVQLGFIVLFQGSPLYKHCVEKGIVKDEIQFIEDRSKNGYNFDKPENLTDSMSDSDFEKLKNDVMTTIYTTGYHVTPIESKIVDNISEVHIKCPYCNEISIFKNMHTPKNGEVQNVGCRHCNSRFGMVSNIYFIISPLMKFIGYNNMIKLSNIYHPIIRRLLFWR